MSGANPIFSRFDTTPPRDRRTDGHTTTANTVLAKCCTVKTRTAALVRACTFLHYAIKFSTVSLPTVLSCNAPQSISRTSSLNTIKHVKCVQDQWQNLANLFLFCSIPIPVPQTSRKAIHNCLNCRANRHRTLDWTMSRQSWRRQQPELLWPRAILTRAYVSVKERSYRSSHLTPHLMSSHLTSLSAIAYSTGQTIKPVCVFASVCSSVRTLIRLHIFLIDFFTKIGTDVTLPRIKDEMFGVNVAPPLPIFP